MAVGAGRSPSVRVRIVAWAVALSTLALAGAGAAFYLIERARVDQRIAETIVQEISEFDAFAATAVDPRTGAPYTDPARLMQGALGHNVPDEHQALIAFVGGRPAYVQGAGVDQLTRSPEFVALVGSLTRGGTGTTEVDGQRIRFAVRAVLPAGADETRRGAFVVATFADRERAELREVLRSYVLVALVALFVVAVGAWSVSGRLLRPLRDLRRTADQISSSDLTRRIEVTGTDDISDLARTFNAMLDRLQTAFAAQRRFLDDAGHELRTPITIVRGHLELLDAGDPADVASTRDLVLDELDRMSRLVDDLVVLARAERPDFLRPVPVDVGSLTDDLLDKARGLGDRAWRIDARAEAQIDADPQRLSQAVLQLAANAVRHTEPGQVVALGSAADASGVRLWVRDEGPGVPEADAARIFERFERGANPSREGAGLGLSIVRAIAGAHGGSVRLDSRPGAGATFTIEIPAAVAVEADPVEVEVP